MNIPGKRTRHVIRLVFSDRTLATKFTFLKLLGIYFDGDQLIFKAKKTYNKKSNPINKILF